MFRASKVSSLIFFPFSDEVQPVALQHRLLERTHPARTEWPGGDVAPPPRRSSSRSHPHYPPTAASNRFRPRPPLIPSAPAKPTSSPALANDVTPGRRSRSTRHQRAIKAQQMEAAALIEVGALDINAWCDCSSGDVRDNCVRHRRAVRLRRRRRQRSWLTQATRGTTGRR